MKIKSIDRLGITFALIGMVMSLLAFIDGVWGDGEYHIWWMPVAISSVILGIVLRVYAYRNKRKQEKENVKYRQL